MSGLPEMTGGIDLKNLCDGYVNLVILKEYFCSYKGDCKISKNLSDGLCMYCVYRTGVKIPELINVLLEEKKRKREEENAGNKGI